MRHTADLCVLAVDAGGTFLKAALVRPDGQLVDGSFLRIPVDSCASAHSIRESYLTLSAAAADHARRTGAVIAAVGVCIPGPFDYASGTSLMTHKYAAINGLSLKPWLAHSLTPDTPMAFLHDSNAFLLGALQSPRYADVRNAAGVTLGTGLGFATLLDGKLRTAENGGPYISIYARPYRDGTSEDYVSRKAILSAYALLHGAAQAGGLDVAEIASLALAGEPDAQLVFAQVGQHLGAILHDILAQHPFECLLLGGAISKSAQLILPTLCTALADLPQLNLVEQAAEIDSAPLLGAARTAINLLD